MLGRIALPDERDVYFPFEEDWDDDEWDDDEELDDDDEEGDPDR